MKTLLSQMKLENKKRMSVVKNIWKWVKTKILRFVSTELDIVYKTSWKTWKTNHRWICPRHELVFLFGALYTTEVYSRALNTSLCSIRVQNSILEISLCMFRIYNSVSVYPIWQANVYSLSVHLWTDMGLYVWYECEIVYRNRKCIGFWVYNRNICSSVNLLWVYTGGH